MREINNPFSDIAITGNVLRNTYFPPTPPSLTIALSIYVCISLCM